MAISISANVTFNLWFVRDKWRIYFHQKVRWLIKHVFFFILLTLFGFLHNRGKKIKQPFPQNFGISREWLKIAVEHLCSDGIISRIKEIGILDGIAAKRLEKFMGIEISKKSWKGKKRKNKTKWICKTHTKILEEREF